MRNRKFRLSDMIPNAWFHKLQEIGKGRSQFNQTSSDSKKKLRQPPPQSKQKQPLIPQPPLPSCSRKSYHFTRELQDNDEFCINSPLPPKQLKSRRSSRSSSPESFDRDIVIDMSSKYSDNAAVKNFDSHLELDLPPIITKKKEKHAKQRMTAEGIPTKKNPASSPGGVRLRNHSPRIGHRKISGRKSTSSRRSFSDSMAVTKSSNDPQKDFRESMVEMIVEKNIRSSKDLEDLLACYLCLNAEEYHDDIIQVFKQIWFDLLEAAL